MFPKSLSIWSGCPFLTYIFATKIGCYPELVPWNTIHILGFITPKLLTIFVMIVAVLEIFQAWIYVRVGIGKLLNGLGVRNIFNTNYTVWEHASVWLAVCFIALL